MSEEQDVSEACVADVGAGAEAAAEPPAKTWSLLAYIAGDNDLSDYGLLDIEELCSVGTSKDVYAGVEIDTVGDWEGSIRYEINEPMWDGRSYRIVIERLAERDRRSSRTLYEFLRWGGNRYPARHRVVAVWSHGGGFQAATRNVAADGSGTSMTIPQLSRALRSASPDLGGVSILGFDACVMCMLEIASELTDVADYLVGSQALVPGNGWPYDWVLSAMLELPTPRELAVRIVDDFARVYADGPDDVTQAAVELARVPDVHAALHRLATALLSGLSKWRKAIFAARDSAQTYEQFADYIDIVDFTRALSERIPDRAIVDLAGGLATCVQAAVVRSSATGPSVARSHGLSMWFPRSTHAYFGHRAQYLQLRDSGPDTPWVRLLDELHA